MIKTVYLDVDGVLACFTRGVFCAIGRKWDYSDPILKTFHWFASAGYSREEIDSLCTIDFWAGLPWMHDGRDILKLVEEKFDNIYLLTAPMSNHGSYTGKMLWIQRHVPQYYERAIVTQIPKCHFAGPDTLLIDDRFENCMEFQSAGGVATLVPRPWSGGGATLAVVRQSLEEL